MPRHEESWCLFSILGVFQDQNQWDELEVLQKRASNLSHDCAHAITMKRFNNVHANINYYDGNGLLIIHRSINTLRLIVVILKPPYAFIYVFYISI